ncbi:gas vesicle protein GvpFL [Mycolicibacterium agri]|uniref:Gas vesicle protein n=1 Tax=Mycolicibacterium agri TaxID=36811 RepID=A0A2A7N557_MYCAG|nr:GvpL/GvpF family gas vesicle protein [Mycolicibacterium agri]PEG38959.1 gas vesicle protein GvpFL [Mycolicibacterium agri]GFG53261.1 gas vesicle protein [Mycolicibacterium agri]
MSTAQETETRSESKTAVYVYGIVPGDVEVQKNAKGVGEPPATVDIIHEGDIAALVSEVPLDQPLGRPEDLQAHAQLLDGTASVAPVLPLRFGAVMTDADSVADELLQAHHDEFAAALEQLEGLAEYIIKGRYNEKEFLSQLLSQDRQAAQLRDDIQNKPKDASRNSQIALGELIANVIEQQRAAHTNEVIEVLGELAAQVNPRDPTHEWDAVHLAMLAEVERQADLEDVVKRLNEEWRDLISVRLLGPLAPYDFVVAAKPGG